MSVDIMPTERHGFYVDFELRPQEDREASIEAGSPVFKDVEFAVITMPGGTLVVDKLITKELLLEWKHGNPQRNKPSSPFAYDAYMAWKEGLDAPVNGTDLKNWPGVTPAQLKMCQGVNIRTVEDLAEANADAIRKMGMGAVSLKDKAMAYLSAATTNKASEQITALMRRLDDLEATNKANAEYIKELEAQINEDEPVTAPKKRGRPAKAAE